MEVMKMNTQQINSQLKIVKLGDQKFKKEGGYYKPTGYALKHPVLGYFSFDKDTPYNPIGGRKALKNILESGGLLNFDDCRWLHEM
jgi:hypothetical protein